MKKVLFICGRNKKRSPTAEELFSGSAGAEVASAGTSPDAENPVTPELLAWADVIFVMEKAQKSKLAARFSSALKDKKIVCLNIPDKYAFNDPALISILLAKAGPYFAKLSP
ncbi:MAG: phosphotyrosine protein phosphatase [Elusimicrobiota bacterium]|nr:MAG: phosphotyrosine protein phosphatase [Elusimicrobiota bacterium]